MTTKTNIEKLQELRAAAFEIATQNPKKLALEMKNYYAEDIRKLKETEEYRDLGTGGRVKREEKLREQYRKQLFDSLQTQQDQYKKVYDDATTLAKTLLTTPAAPTKDAISVKLFEQELESLKTSSLLGTNAKETIQKVDAFIGEYCNDPYFASVIRDNFGQLSQNVLTIESNVENRHSLAKVYEQVESKSLSDEQTVAKEMLGIFGDGVPKFYRESSSAYSAISTIIGTEHAQYLDKPSEWLEAHAAAEKAVTK